MRALILVPLAWLCTVVSLLAAAGGGPSTGGGGAGSITNLSPNVAALIMTSAATVNATNTARLLTNWNSGSASNMITDVSGTNGFIRVTNSGWYNVGMSVVYRSAGTAIRTNSWNITTNVGGVGLTAIGPPATGVSDYASNFVSEALSRAVFLASNTYVAVSYQQTIGPTNDLVVEGATLWAAATAGTTFGSGSGSLATNANQFGASTTLTLKDGVRVTNAVVQSSLSVPGNQTNTGGGFLVMEDAGLSTIILYGGSGGPALLTSNANLAFGPWTKSITADSNGNGRWGYTSQPYGDLGYGTPTTFTGGWNMLVGSNAVLANTIALKGITASRALIANSSGQVTNVTSGSPSTEYVKADGTTGVPSGTGAAGNSASIQFNEGGVFAGTNFFIYDRTNNAVSLGTGNRPESTLQISNSSQATLFVDGTSGGLGRMGIRPFAIGSEASAVIPGYSLMFQGTNILTMGHKSIFSRALLQVPGVSNHTVALGSSGTLTMEGTNAFYSATITGTTTFADTFQQNTLYTLFLTNDASTVNWPASWQWVDGQTLSSAPAAQAGRYVVNVLVNGTGTNAWVAAGKSYVMSGGWGTALSTNTSTGVVSVTLTNRPASIATNATSVTVDFSDTANVQLYNAWFHLTTNLVVSPTNLVVGRTLAVYFDTNALTYDVTFTNTAANRLNWNFNVSTNGSTSFTKTNTMRARVFLTAETNGVISAEMGYYR